MLGQIGEESRMDWERILIRDLWAKNEEMGQLRWESMESDMGYAFLRCDIVDAECMDSGSKFFLSKILNMQT